jgi:predicted  nucleic acid-binding Zn-ribbon protein
MDKYESMNKEISEVKVENKVILNELKNVMARLEEFFVEIKLARQEREEIRENMYKLEKSLTAKIGQIKQVQVGILTKLSIAGVLLMQIWLLVKDLI